MSVQTSDADLKRVQMPELFDGTGGNVLYAQKGGQGFSSFFADQGYNSGYDGAFSNTPNGPNSLPVLDANSNMVVGGAPAYGALSVADVHDGLDVVTVVNAGAISCFSIASFPTPQPIFFVGGNLSTGVFANINLTGETIDFSPGTNPWGQPGTPVLTIDILGGALILAGSSSAPTYVKGGIYFDTTLSKLCIGGASGWETVTSV
jgi:hypothetical protein